MREGGRGGEKKATPLSHELLLLLRLPPGDSAWMDLEQRQRLTSKVWVGWMDGRGEGWREEEGGYGEGVREVETDSS